MPSRWSRTYARHGCSSSRRRPANAALGFTLIEVTVALAILMIAVIALLAGYGLYYRLFTSARIVTVGQNLAQLVMEDIRSKSKTELEELCMGISISDVANYPTESGGVTGYPDDPGYHKDWVYDVGSQPGRFTIQHVQSVLSHIPTASTDEPSGLVLPAGIIDVAPSDQGAGNWDYTVIFNNGVFPHYTKHIVITDVTPSISQVMNKIYRIDVTVTWSVGSSSKTTTVLSEK